MNTDEIPYLGENVLPAEDHIFNQQLTAEWLKMTGCRYTIVDNGREALKEVQQQPFDLVLMDIQMPEMDGYEAARQIRQFPELEDLLIIAMTADAMSGDREKALESGMNEYLTKLVDERHLFQTMQTLLPSDDSVERGTSGRLKESPTSVGASDSYKKTGLPE